MQKFLKYYIHQNKMNCKRCNIEFKDYTNKQYCSKKCRRDSYKDVKGIILTEENLCPSSKGTLNELRVALDLISKGFYVFRSLSPNSPCDLVAIKKEKTLLIEVKTLQYTVDGKYVCSKITNKNGRFDIAAYAGKNTIIYKPELNV